MITNIVLIIVVAIATILLVVLLFRRDDLIEERRGNMLLLYARLRELGLERLAGIAKAYVIGDYSGLYSEAKQLFNDLQDPAIANTLLEKAFYAQLEKRAENPYELQKIKDCLFE